MFRRIFIAVLAVLLAGTLFGMWCDLSDPTLGVIDFDPTRTPTVTPTPTATSPGALPTEAPPTPTSTPVSEPTPYPTSAPVPTVVPEVAAPTGPSFSDICGVSGSDMTDVQRQAHADRFVGQRFTNWQGYIYDVRSDSGGYVVLVAMERRGSVLLWNRDMEIYGVPDYVAQSLRVEQPVLFSGTVGDVGIPIFGSLLCNPLVIEDGVLDTSAPVGN